MFSRCVSAALLCAYVMCAEEPVRSRWPQLSSEVTVVSSYLWRGTVVNDSPSLQPSLTAAWGGLSVNLWSNVSRSPLHNQAWTESDITLEYSHSLGRWTLTGGLTDYEFVDTPAAEGNRTREIYAGLSLDVPLQPTFRAYRDIGIGNGNYYSAAVTQPFRIAGLRGESGLLAGLNQHQFQSQTAISNVEWTTSLDAITRDRVVITPFLTVVAGHRTLFGRHAVFGMRVAQRD